MLLIDRYICKLFMKFLFAGAFVFLMLFWTVDLMANMGRLDAGIWTVARYYFFATPFIMYQLFPANCLLATLFTLSQMNRQNELVALHSFGMGLSRIVLPILSLVIFFSALSFWLKETYGPYFYEKKDYVETVEINKKEWVPSAVQSNKVWYRSGSVLFNLQMLDFNSKKAEGATFFYFSSDWELSHIIRSLKVKIADSGDWLLNNGFEVLNLNSEKESVQFSPFHEKRLEFDTDLKNLQKSSLTVEKMRIGILRNFIQANKQAGLNTLKYEVEYHSRVSFSLTAIILTLLGIPFVVASRRSGKGMINVVICLMLSFSYWTLYFYGVTLGKNNAISPFLAGWGVNLISFIVALVLILRLKK